MKIYFTCSTAKFEDYRQQYFQIRSYLVDQGHTLTRDWLPKAQKMIGEKEGTAAKNKLEFDNVKEVYQQCIQAIKEADLVIIEDTVSNFSTGHQITVSLQKQKPTLVLWCEPKHRHFKQTFIQGIDSEYLQVAEYNENNLEKIITAFIKRYAKAKQRNRFHLVLSESEREYLDWAQYNKEMSRTELIRHNIRQAMDTDDEYQKYLSR